MIKKIKTLFARIFSKVLDGFRPVSLRSDKRLLPSSVSVATTTHDPHLLDSIKSLWAFGEFERIAETDERAVVDHPQRALLAAYLAMAHEQVHQGSVSGRSWVERAKLWGCPQSTLIELALANVHSSLAELKVMVGDEQSARQHLSESLSLASPGLPADLMLPPRLKAVSDARRITLDIDGRPALNANVRLTSEYVSIPGKSFDVVSIDSQEHGLEERLRDALSESISSDKLSNRGTESA